MGEDGIFFSQEGVKAWVDEVAAGGNLAKKTTWCALLPLVPQFFRLERRWRNWLVWVGRRWLLALSICI